MNHSKINIFTKKKQQQKTPESLIINQWPIWYRESTAI